MKQSEIVFGALRLPVDYLAAFSAFMLAYYLRPITDLIPGVQYHFFPEQLPALSQYVPLALISAAVLMILFAASGLYSLRVTRRLPSEVFRIAFWVSAWLMFIIAYHFLIVHALFFSRIALAHIWLFTMFFVIAGRLLIALLQRALLHYGVGRRHILFVGVSDVADRFYGYLRENPCYRVLGALDGGAKPGGKSALPVIGRPDELETIVKKYGVEEIIQADPDADSTASRRLLAFCRSRQIKYHFIPDLMRLQRTNVEVQMFGQTPLITLKQTPLDGWGHIFKRSFDLFFAAIFIIVLLPLWLILPVFIRLDSAGPVIYKSRRQYRDKIFDVYKFRTMVPDADFKKKSLLHKSERQGPLFKIKNDPRVTRFGRFLRRTSLDELPQFFNVLMGSMSLVGPRPHLPEEIEKYQQHHYEVFALKPGLTGLAQVSGRSHLDFEEEVRLDVYYIENWSLLMDMRILLKSVGVIFRADGH